MVVVCEPPVFVFVWVTFSSTHWYISAERTSCAEQRVGKDGLRHRATGEVDEAPLVGGVDRVGGDGHDVLLAFVQGAGAFDGAPLVPDEHGKANQEDDESPCDSLE